MFLIGTGQVVVDIDGWKGKAAEIVCYIMHGVLKLFHVSPKRVYRQFRKTAMRYAGCKTKYVTSYEYAGGVKDKIVRDELFPVKEVVFEDTVISLPANNHEFLEKVYGDYMKIPPKEQQINHFPYMIQFEGEEPYFNE